MTAEPPQSAPELLQRAQRLAGMSLGELAKLANTATPENLRRHKGWVGELIERSLGAAAGNQALPDFPTLGIELKTIPIGADHVPTESTFVSVVPQANNAGITWANSVVRAKLSHVLWVPVEADRNKPLAARQIGYPLLWQPSGQEEAILERDFRELMEMICLGNTASVSAHHGTWLQIRPKGANAKARTIGINREGKRFLTLPLGFYLRRAFTAEILKRYYAF